MIVLIVWTFFLNDWDGPDDPEDHMETRRKGAHYSWSAIKKTSLLHYVPHSFLTNFFIYFHTTIKYIKGTVCLCLQIAKANRGGQSYTQSVVKPVIIKLQQYNNIRLNTTMLN